MNYIYKIIDMCKREDLKFYNQCLVVLESHPITNGASSESCSHFFQDNKVSTILAVERPHKDAQLYIAESLGTKYHFSCPTGLLSSIVGAIQEDNNKDVKLLFIPRTTELFTNEDITVFNKITIPPIFSNDNAKLIYDSVLENGEKVVGGSLASSGKRSKFSYSVGLQIMYAHKQHCARYCMFPHSKPHVADVKNCPGILTDSIKIAYNHVLTELQRKSDNKAHPFDIQESNHMEKVEISERLQLRNEFLTYFSKQGYVGDLALLTSATMFEACTVQPTDALAFHKDLMNCESLDKTIALLVPTKTSPGVKNDDSHNCLSYLFYTRKSVGQHAKKMSELNKFLVDRSQCNLTRFCVKGIMNVGGVFDYQGSLFEADESLNDIADNLRSNVNHCCADVKEFCGLDCFKHGAAFDKMGYYSIFVNVFFCLYYKGVAANVDDCISLCMFFGLVCNGTSSLAGVWSCIYEHDKQVMKWLEKRDYHTKLFDCLMKLYCKRYGLKNNKDGHVLYGNSKLPRYQYSGYATSIMDNAESIHKNIKLFLDWRGSSGKSKKESVQHSYLFNKMKMFKGIGPLSFNQLWHSMCLCGILPVGYIQSSIIAPASGPSKLMLTFFPYIKKHDVQTKKLTATKSTLSKLGFKKVTEFFLENMMCESWRIAGMQRLFMKNMTFEEKCDVLLSDEFQQIIKDAKPTGHPDIYYRNPYTEDYQHLFRVVDKELIMRPSFMPNSTTASVNLHCSIQCETTTGKLSVSWKGDLSKTFHGKFTDLFT